MEVKVSSQRALNDSAAGSFYARDGYEVKLWQPSWALSKDVTVRVDRVAKYLNGEMCASCRHVLAFYAKGNSPHYVEALNEVFVKYLKSTKPLAPFSVESIISYRSFLGKKGEPELATLRTFIRKWHSLGYDGVPIDTIRLLKTWSLSGGPKGRPILSMCPESGPLTDIEMDAVITASMQAFGAGKLSIYEVSMLMTLAMTGRRPIQITGLKICDIRSISNKYYLAVPRVKQRKDGGWRVAFKNVQIVQDLWRLLQAQADSVHKKFNKRIRVEAELRSQLPLFPNYSAIDHARDLDEQIKSDRLHLRVETMSTMMGKIAKKINVVSERTGTTIHINAYRFRYTFGTNIAREGGGELLIAEALDHTDTQHTGVYVKNLPDIVERIDKAVAYQLAPIAKAFQGIIVNSEREAQRGNDPTSRVSDGKDCLGNCGSYGACRAFAPTACYTCNHFQPWRDGPHESVLDYLLHERERIIETTGDLKIAAINDRLILAVSDVVLKCKSSDCR